MTDLITDIISTTPLNDAEQLLLTTHDPKSQGNARKIAQAMKSKKFLSTYNCAACHKIPYSSMEKSFLKLVQTNPAPRASGRVSSGITAARLHGPGFAVTAAQEVASLKKSRVSEGQAPSSPGRQSDAERF
ncbi:hypothetical protein FGA82_22015 [Pseudomonas fluorescens]|uniref:hypothetical protein n=1 Tax=Pseudomonas fluorescens TaxID=294 RepID=UPI001130C5D1|nr:hypothetical protein [Pseudomonas fluorescens]TMU73948.1 hypothetical protein FGA82_22015 [Pseudomonas fluorescens]